MGYLHKYDQNTYLNWSEKKVYLPWVAGLLVVLVKILQIRLQSHFGRVGLGQLMKQEMGSHHDCGVMGRSVGGWVELNHFADCYDELDHFAGCCGELGHSVVGQDGWSP
jgi:hypothetical protein